MTLRVKIELLGARAPWRQARTDLIEEVKFARDSPLERKGFEPLVPVRANSCRHHPADCPTCFGGHSRSLGCRVCPTATAAPASSKTGISVGTCHPKSPSMTRGPRVRILPSPAVSTWTSIARRRWIIWMRWWIDRRGLQAVQLLLVQSAGRAASRAARLRCITRLRCVAGGRRVR
jgi:hypothetical protein